MIERTVTQTDLTRVSTAKAIAVTMPDDDLTFFSALWLWVPVGLMLWAAIIWTVTRLV